MYIIYITCHIIYVYIYTSTVYMYLYSYINSREHTHIYIYVYPKTPKLCYSHAFLIPCHSRVLGEMLLFTYFVIQYVNTTSKLTYVPILAAKAQLCFGHWWKATPLMDYPIEINLQSEHIIMNQSYFLGICYFNHCSHDWSPIFTYPKGRWGNCTGPCRCLHPWLKVRPPSDQIASGCWWWVMVPRWQQWQH